jgi:hypothetical protein
VLGRLHGVPLIDYYEGVRFFVAIFSACFFDNPSFSRRWILLSISSSLFLIIVEISSFLEDIIFDFLSLRILKFLSAISWAMSSNLTRILYALSMLKKNSLKSSIFELMNLFSIFDIKISASEKYLMNSLYTRIASCSPFFVRKQYSRAGVSKISGQKSRLLKIIQHISS